VWEQANFWGCEDFCPNFPKLARKSCCATFAYKFFPTKIMKTFFGVTSKTRGLHLFFYKCWSPFFAVKQRWSPFLHGVFRDFACFSGILPRFSGILPKFLGISPGFSTNQNFWGCACTPAAYTTGPGHHQAFARPCNQVSQTCF